MFPFKGINCKSQCHENKDFFDSHFDRVFTQKTRRSDFPKPNVLLIAMISGVKFKSNKEVSSEYCCKLSNVSTLRKLALHNSYQKANHHYCCAITPFFDVNQTLKNEQRILLHTEIRYPHHTNLRKATFSRKENKYFFIGLRILNFKLIHLYPELLSNFRPLL